MNLDAAVQAFATESSELLLAAESALLELESNPTDAERINELFRAFHTIKGSAGMFGFQHVVEFTHGVESLLGRVRDGNQALDESLISLFLGCRDHINALIDLALSHAEPDSQLSAVGSKLSSQVNALLQGSQIVEPQNSAPPLDHQPSTETSASGTWHIALRFRDDAMRNGMDPIAFIRYLRELGDIRAIRVIDSRMPDIDALDPECCYLGFDIQFNSSASLQAIEEVFLFARDDCDLHILPPGAKSADWRELLDALPEDPQQLLNLWAEMGALDSSQVDALLHPKAEPDPAPSTIASSAEVVPLHPAKASAAVDEAITVKRDKPGANANLRVDAAKLEQLINQVGELVINGAGVQQHAQRIGDPALLEAMEVMSRLVEEIRDTTLGLRMVQIGETFNRFRRLVREISKELGKDIELSISGAEAELDKSVVEKITDPLTHLVRNAIDHGIETREARISAGKNPQGTVSLHAYHDSGSIVIEITDDGGGLRREKILAKALERGLIDHGRQLSDQDIFQLIFEPGFSTADQVTNLSGRGVGMDVVRRNIDALRGQVEVDSTPGYGSTFRIRLPLTLAIIDGFQVRVGDSIYVVPLDMVVECIELPQSLHHSMSTSDYIEFRGTVLPALRLGQYFGGHEDFGKHADIVVVHYAGMTAGLVVDQLLGEHQTVIKPLGAVFQHLRGISGATILGSGEVALIVDVPELMQRVVNEHNNRQGAKPLEIRASH